MPDIKPDDVVGTGPEHEIVLRWAPQTGVIHISERPALTNRAFWDYFLAEVDRMCRREYAKDEAGRIVRV